MSDYATWAHLAHDHTPDDGPPGPARITLLANIRVPQVHRGHYVLCDCNDIPFGPTTYAGAVALRDTHNRENHSAPFDFDELLAHMRAFHGMPACFDPIIGCENELKDDHDRKYHGRADGKVGSNFGLIARPHPVDYLGTEPFAQDTGD